MTRRKNLTPTEVCAKIVQWAVAAQASTPGAGSGYLAVGKSDLLERLIYGRESPSQTPCPVHKGKWHGCHFAWPGAEWSDGKPIPTGKMEQEWYDAGCRCYQHRGSSCTTGWQPDKACGCGERP